MHCVVFPGRCICDPISRKGEVVGGSAMVQFKRMMVVSYRLCNVTITLTIWTQFAIKCLDARVDNFEAKFGYEG